jgi:putative heme-binding domain-containing protein
MEKNGDKPGGPNPNATPVPPVANPPKSGYVTKEMPDLVRTADLSFRPIDVKLGPDGALYVADWSNPVINHGEVDFRDPRRDHHSGRIWRISKKDAPAVKWEALVGGKNRDLLAALLSGSEWAKEQARRVLQVRGMQKDTSTDDPSETTGGGFGAIGIGSAMWADAKADEQAKMEATWIGAAFGFPFDESFAAKAKDARFRAACVPIVAASRSETARALASNPNKTDAFDPETGREWIGKIDKILEQGISDSNPRVRLEAMRALSRIPTARSAELVLDAAVRSQALPRADEALPRESKSAAAPPARRAGALGSDAGDVFYRHAAWLSINDLARPWLDALASGAWKPEGREKQLDFALNALPPDTARGALVKVLGTEPRDFAKGPWAELIGRSGGPAELRKLLDAMLVSFGVDCCPGEELKNIRALPIDDATALRCVNALLEAARTRGQRPDGDLLPVERLVFRTGGAVRAGMIRLVGYWKPAPAIDWLRGVFDESGLDLAQAASAIESLRDIGGAPAVALLKKLAVPATPAPLRQRAAVALAALDAKAPEVVAALAASPDENTALTAWRDLFKTQKAIDALAASVPADLPKPVAAAGVRAAREAGKKGEALLAALTPLAGTVPKTAPAATDFKGIAARMWTQGGDAAQGELIYRRATLGCTTCHAIGGAGGVVGPSLTSLGASAPADYIIESVLVPNAKVKEGYNGVTLKLKDGTEVMGIQARETATEVILRNVAGQETAVPKANITGKTDIGSIMPAGLVDALNDNERMNLYCFLAELGKPGPFDASKANAARVWRLYPGTATDAALKAAANDASANAFTLVDGRLPKAQLTAALQLVTNPGDVIYAVTQFQSSGKTRLDLTGIAKAFLDGAPLNVTPNIAPELPAGIHTLAVKLDVPALPDVLRASSADASFVTN